nr:MAG TPA: hypothetical protein [Caudoviricetes sp.]
MKINNIFIAVYSFLKENILASLGLNVVNKSTSMAVLMGSPLPTLTVTLLYSFK